MIKYSMEDPFEGSLPIWRISCPDWLTKKEKLLKLRGEDKSQDCEDYYTDYHRDANENDYLGKFTEIMAQELSGFNEQLKEESKGKILGLNLSRVWTQSYKQHQRMEPHTHDHGGFSAVLYVDFLKEFHRGTTFQAPYLEPFSGGVINSTPIVEEGDLVIFPSNLIHCGAVNNSNKRRTIISFNLTIDWKD